MDKNKILMIALSLAAIGGITYIALEYIYTIPEERSVIQGKTGGSTKGCGSTYRAWGQPGEYAYYTESESTPVRLWRTRRVTIRVSPRDKRSDPVLIIAKVQGNIPVIEECLDKPEPRADEYYNGELAAGNYIIWVGEYESDKDRYPFEMVLDAE